jgi:TonB family protein
MLLLAMLLLAVLVLSIPSFADDREKAVELVQKAAAESQLSNLKDSYTLKMSFRVPGAHGTQGTYQYWSVSHLHWRSEINARGFHSTEVGEPDKRWVSGDLPYTPEPIGAMLRMIAAGTAFDWPVNKVKEVHLRNGDDGRCVILKEDKKNELHVCFDPATSLLRAVYDRGNRYEFHNYETVAGRKLPRQMDYYDGRILVVEANLTSLTLLPSPDPALLVPPINAEAWDWCENMEPPKLIRSVRPQAPRGTWGGYNLFWVVVDTDGHVDEGGLMQSAGAALDVAAASAMKKWLFRPAMCNGMPIRVKTTASFAFNP